MLCRCQISAGKFGKLCHIDLRHRHGWLSTSRYCTSYSEQIRAFGLLNLFDTNRNPSEMYIYCDERLGVWDYINGLQILSDILSLPFLSENNVPFLFILNPHCSYRDICASEWKATLLLYMIVSANLKLQTE